MSKLPNIDTKVGIVPKTIRINQVWDDDVNEIVAAIEDNDTRIATIETSGISAISAVVVSAEWTSGLSFNVTADNYPVAGTFYSSTAASVTLDAADATLDRIDLIVAIAPVSPATVGTVGFIKGVPASASVVLPPDYDPSLVYPIKQVTIKAAATVPEGTSIELVFDENAGAPAEFVASFSSTTIKASLADFFSGTTSIEAINPLLGDKTTFTRSAVETTEDIDILTFYIKLKAAFEASYIYVKFFNGTTQIGTTYSFFNGMNGFVESDLTWQKITITSADLNLPISDFDKIEIYPYKAFSGYFIDLIQLYKGTATLAYTIPANSIGVTELKRELKGILNLGDVSGTVSIDFSQDIIITFNMVGDTTLAFTNLVAGKSIELIYTSNLDTYILTHPAGFKASQLTGFDGALTNYETIYCPDATTPIFKANIDPR